MYFLTSVSVDNFKYNIAKYVKRHKMYTHFQHDLLY